VGFLAVSVVQDRQRVETAVKRLGFELPQAVTTGNLLATVDVVGVPVTLFLSREGRLVGMVDGPISAEVLDSAAAELLGS